MKGMLVIVAIERMDDLLKERPSNSIIYYISNELIWFMKLDVSSINPTYFLFIIYYNANYSVA